MPWLDRLWAVNMGPSLELLDSGTRRSVQLNQPLPGIKQGVFCARSADGPMHVRMPDLHTTRDGWGRLGHEEAS